MNLSKRILVLIVCCLMMVFLNSVPAMAWKVGTHVYSANLILEELKANHGILNIPPFGNFAVPEEYRVAVLAYPEAFRAGAIGPDGFPDIYVGQAFIHPNEGNMTSGDWLKHLVQKVYEIDDDAKRQKATAFVLGFMIHYSGDLFGHTYVNNWAKGQFPNVTDGVTPAELQNITRHNVVEGFIDKRIPAKYTKKEYLKIDAPNDFIFENLAVNGPSKKSEINPIYRRPYPKHFDLFLTTRAKLVKEVNNSGSSLNVVQKAKKAYCQRWIADIDEGFRAWVDTSEKVAQSLLEENGTTKAKKAISDWASSHLLSMAGYPDTIGDMFKALGNIADFVAGLLGPLKQKWDELKEGFIDKIFVWAIGVKYTVLVETWTNPEKYLMNSKLFEPGAKNRLISEMGNFNTNTNPDQQTFIPFYNTLMMAKMVMIGSDEMNKLASKALKKSTILYPVDTKTRLIRARELDVTIHTANVRLAGTDDDVRFGIELKDDGKVEKLFDKSGYNDFERNDTDTYRFSFGKSICLSDIKKVWLKKDDDGLIDDGWKVYSIEIKANGVSIFYRKIDKWLEGSSKNRKWEDSVSLKDQIIYSKLTSRIIDFIPSLDGSRGWETPNCVLWKEPEKREKIFKRVFKLN